MLKTTIAGKYRIVRLLGEGGMGAVYEAEHTTTGRRLAVKLITVHAGPQRKEAIARFEREARVAGSLDTEHIVQVIDSGLDEALDMPFMVMELLQGEDVQALLERVGPLPPDLALRVAAQTCVGLRQAHQANIIHRDVKPANLFLAQRDEGKVLVKILDFGIAKMRSERPDGHETGKLTRTGTMVGSPYFMSPEQALGEKDIDFRSDIWSLGVVLYAMLTGQTPHEDVESLGQIIMSICSKPAASVQDRAPWVDPAAAAVVHKALTIDKSKRYASMSDMLDALRALLPGGSDITKDMLGPVDEGTRARVAPRLASDQVDLGATVSAKSSRSPGARRVSSDTMSTSTMGGDVRPPRARSRALIVAAGAAIAIAGGAAVYVASRPATAVPDPRPLPAVSTGPAPSAAVTVEPAPLRDPAERKVALEIAPDSAQVEVDGERVEVKAGRVEIAGALGSKHKVRVVAGAQVEERVVVISQDGPEPTKIEALPRAGAPRATATATATAATASAKPDPSKPVKPKPTSTSKMDTKFDE